MVEPNTSSTGSGSFGTAGDKIAFVTGAAGFIGRHTCAMFADLGWTVVGFDRVELRDDPTLPLTPASRMVVGPVNEDTLRQAAQQVGEPRVIIHAAGGSSVGESLAAPAEDFDRTLGSIRSMLEFMRVTQSKARLIFLSSAAVYGCSTDHLISERSAVAPISPYGLHKFLAEEMIRGWGDLFNLDVCVVRMFSIYGPGIRKQLLWDIARRLSARPSALELFGTGQEERDFLYITDVVRLVLRLAEMKPGAAPRLINGGCGGAASVREVAQGLCTALDVDVQLNFNGVVREGDPKRLVADATSAKAIGFIPEIPLDQGLKSFAAWVESALETAS